MTRLKSLRNIRLVAFIERVVKEYIQDDMVTYAAALSYHSLFAMAPFLLFFVSLLDTLDLSEYIDWFLDNAQRVLPHEAFGVVEGVADEIRSRDQSSIISVGAIVAVWSASVGVRALMNALNSAYGVPETRAVWKKYLFSILLTLSTAVLLVLASLLMVVGPQAAEWGAELFGFGETFVTLWTWLRWPVIVFLLILMAALAFYVVPNISQPFRLITPGAVFAVLVWLVASWGFTFYVTHFANYDAVYGSIGGIIVLMLFLFISSNVLLLGAEINAEVYELKVGEPVPEDQSAEPDTIQPEPLEGAKPPVALEIDRATREARAPDKA